MKRRPVLAVLLALSEGRTVPQAQLDEAAARGAAFVRAANIGYVVIDRTRASPALADAAITILGLEKIGQSGARELYRPRHSELGTTSVSARATSR